MKTPPSFARTITHAQGVSQVRLSVATPDGDVVAIASARLTSDGSWRPSVRLVPSHSPEGYAQAQLDVLAAMASEAVADARLLQAARQAGMD